MRPFVWIAPILLAAACNSPRPNARPSANATVIGPITSVASTQPTPSAKPAVPPPPEPEPERTPPIPIPTAPIPALAVDGPKAFVADESGLVELSPQGPKQVILPGALSYCNVDARGKVVWFERDGALYAFDLVDRTIHTILSAEESDALTGDVIISWGNEQLGGEDKVGYDVALQITMTSPPKIEVSIGCDGDRMHYCYVLSDTDGISKRILLDDLQRRKGAIEATTFASPSYVASVAARGANASLWSKPRSPPPIPKKKPKVDKEECPEYPDACGKLEAIPASPLWKVTVGNARGDFYSESYALWDAATNEFLSIGGGKLVRSKTPENKNDWGGMRTSSTGILSFEGTVFDGKTIYYVPKGDHALSCGWSDGGFRVRGVRG